MIKSASVHNPQPVDVSQRIVGWTNNLLATSVVVIVALVVGRQLVYMWVGDRTDNTNISTINTSVFNELNFAELQFGDGPWQMQRETIPLQGQAANKTLLDRCQQLLLSSEIPADAPSDSELRLLRDSLNWKPVAQQAGKWRLFQPPEKSADRSGLPAVIGIRDDLTGKHTSRLVSFGMALPEPSGQSTTLLAFQRRDETGDALPIPDQCQRTMSVAAPGFGRLVGFRGGSIDKAIAFFDRWASESNFQSSTGWHQTAVSASRRFVSSEKTSEAGSVQVNLNLNADGQLRGLLSIEFIEP